MYKGNDFIGKYYQEIPKKFNVSQLIGVKFENSSKMIIYKYKGTFVYIKSFKIFFDVLMVRKT
ncbi:hypothetical protein C6A34_26305 [Bacillus thuringiensis]|nr:hypothetical protein C6A34_26305 [Bacillus thuringiensis]